MNLWESAWVIARRDFVASVFSRFFILFLLAPVALIGFMIFFNVATERQDRAASQPVVAVVTDSATADALAQTIQLFGTIVHKPKLIVLDEPFSGLDAINQGRLEHMIRDEAAAGTTVIFSTHVIHHAERLCERIAIIADGEVRFEGLVSDARERLRPQVRLKTRAAEGAWRKVLPADAVLQDGFWTFEQPKSGIEPLLKGLLDGGAGIEELSVERRGLHDAFVAIAGESVAREMEAEEAAALGDAA